MFSSITPVQSKGYRVVVYLNGDAATPGVRLLLNHRTCKSFSQLLHLITDTLHLQTSVRRLYNIKTGKALTRLRELDDGMSIACAGVGAFQKVAYKPRSAIDTGQRRTEHEVCIH